MYLKSFLTAGAIALGFAGATSASTCPDNAVLTRTITLTGTAPAAVAGCYAYGEGNINGNPAQDPILAGQDQDGNTFFLGAAAGGVVLTDLVVLDKDDTTDPIGEVLDGILSGVISIADFAGLSDYTSLILGVKVGTNLDPSWAAFFVSGAGDYTLFVDPERGAGFSHAILYGVEDDDDDDQNPPPIPLPAGGLLLLTGLGVIAAVRRRKPSA